MIEIRDDIPKPEKNAGAPIKYPFEKMQVGQCFVYEIEDGEDQNAAQRSILSTAKQRGYKITTQRQEGKLLVWLDEAPNENR